MQRPLPRPGADAVRFALFNCVAVLVAHAIVYLAHEYSHAAVAWLLGWQAGPFAIDYGKPTVDNLLFLNDVGDAVDYPAIFTAGKGVEAAVIALAGVVIGNVLLYLIVARCLGLAAVQGRPFVQAGLYWIALMCAGNVWSYVPTRALTTHADIALAAQGFGISTWLLFPILLGPALAVVLHFFLATYRRRVAGITGLVPARVACVALLTAYWFFAYFGSAGADGGYGPVSQGLALVSKCVLFPLAGMWLWVVAPAGPASVTASA